MVTFEIYKLDLIQTNCPRQHKVVLLETLEVEHAKLLPNGFIPKLC